MSNAVMRLRFTRRRKKTIPHAAADAEFVNPPDEIETEFDVAHSEANILNWMQYLPQDCIERMIRLRWDLST
jgi:hypothetical protein